MIFFIYIKFSNSILSKPSHLPILIIWILNLHINMCLNQEKPAVIHFLSQSMFLILVSNTTPMALISNISSDRIYCCSFLFLSQGLVSHLPEIFSILSTLSTIPFLSLSYPILPLLNISIFPY